MTPTTARAEVRINKWNKIPDDDHYVTNGLSSLLLGAKYYTEANEKYACVPEEVLAAVTEFIPLPADIKWSSRLKSAEKYFSQHGLFPSTTTENRWDKIVARWLADQKRELQTGVLGHERESLLDTCIPEWRRSQAELSWDKSFKETQAYFAAYGVLPRRKSRDDVNADKLGGWVSTQKTLLKNGFLADSYVEQLDTHLPTWRFDQSGEWYVFLQRVSGFIQANGSVPRDNSDDSEEKSYGLWIKRQRLKSLKGLLDKAQVEALDATVPNWEVTIEDRWNHILQEVCDHFAVHGSLPKARHKGAYGSLGVWVQTQKELRRLGKIKEERKVILDEKLPLWRESVEDKWERDMHSVAAYFTEHRAYPSNSSNDPEVGFLGEWINGARRKLKDGLMPDERKAKLDNTLPYWDDLWKTNIMLVTEYVGQHGRMPRLKSKDKREEVLGRWASRQKRLSTAGELGVEYKDALERALFSWNEIISGYTPDVVEVPS